MKVIFLILSLVLSDASASVFDLTQDELSPSTEDILIRKSEKHLQEESMIYDFNSKLGIKDQRHFTGEDKNRFSLAGHISSDYEHLQDLLGIEVTYMRRSSSYSRFWYGAQFFNHKTYFDAITQNPTLSTNPNSDASMPRSGKIENTVMGAGLGVGYRFKLLLDFIHTEDWFESIDVFANAILLDETFIKKKYQGVGLTTNYGLHKRSSTSFFYGGKLSYNLASVSREAIGDEKKKERSLSLGWLSLAFELGYFY